MNIIKKCLLPRQKKRRKTYLNPTDEGRRESERELEKYSWREGDLRGRDAIKLT